MADLVGSFISAEVNRRQQERAFQQQKELQSDAQGYNTLMFNMANAYNSPAAQMARFKAAGLNPNLMYGQMANTASAPSISAGSAPSPSQMQAPSLMETAQLGLIDAQKDNIEADTANKQKDFDVKDWQLNQDKMWQDFERDANVELVKQQGLAAAIGNWLNGAVPRDADDPQSHNGFADIYRSMKSEIDDFRDNLRNEWKLTDYDKRYMDRCFESICENDKESFDFNVKKLRSQSAVLKALSENEWMQFLDYLTDKLMGLAQSGAGIYATVRRAR
ncbi:MAG: hypothetical protein IJL48_12055 [Bacteroidales bacterium]|nr:hypothetical protein [Bacteroidales bacterium]